MRWPLRAGVIVAFASTALLLQRAALAGGRLADGPAGSMIARLDLAAPLLIALVAFVTARRQLTGHRSLAARIGWIPAVYIGWILTIGFAKTALHIQFSPRRLLSTLVIFRGLGAPEQGLAAGVLLLTMVLTAILMPVLVGLTRSRRGSWLVPVCLVVAALAYRTVCTATGHLALFGPLSWFPNHLDLVAVGLGVALAEHSITDVALKRRLRFGGIVVALTAFLAAAFLLGLPRSPLLESAIDVHVQAIAAAIFSAGVLGAACLVPPAFTARHLPRITRVVAIVASWPVPRRRTSVHPGCPPVPRAGVRVRRRRVPARQPGCPVRLVAADRRRLRRRSWSQPSACVGLAQTWRMAIDGQIADGAARHRRHGFLRSCHHLADRGAGAHRRTAIRSSTTPPRTCSPVGAGSPSH